METKTIYVQNKILYTENKEFGDFKPMKHRLLGQKSRDAII